MAIANRTYIDSVYNPLHIPSMDYIDFNANIYKLFDKWKKSGR